MQKISLDYIIQLQEQWQRGYTPDTAAIYCAIAREVMHRIIDNDYQLSNPLSFSIDYDFDNYNPVYYAIRQIAKTDILSIEKDDDDFVVVLK